MIRIYVLRSEKHSKGGSDPKEKQIEKEMLIYEHIGTAWCNNVIVDMFEGLYR